MIAGLEKRSREAEISVMEYLIGWVESGRTFVQLASELSKDSGLDITSQQVRRHAQTLSGSEREGADPFARARLIGAHSIVEEALSIADEAGNTREEIAKAKLRVDTRLWTAERWNQRDLGQQKGTNVVISLPGLHLDAMRARATAVASISTPALPASEEAIEVEAEAL